MKLLKGKLRLETISGFDNNLKYMKLLKGELRLETMRGTVRGWDM